MRHSRRNLWKGYIYMGCRDGNSFYHIFYLLNILVGTLGSYFLLSFYFVFILHVQGQSIQ